MKTCASCPTPAKCRSAGKRLNAKKSTKTMGKIASSNDGSGYPDGGEALYPKKPIKKGIPIKKKPTVRVYG